MLEILENARKIPKNTEKIPTDLESAQIANKSQKYSNKLFFWLEKSKGGVGQATKGKYVALVMGRGCQGHSSLDAPSELNPPQRIPSPLLLHY